ncbi:MAG: hypothetical protein M9965_20005 [Anaerolineae bacterium]|nr:hypothetical protein [Anaerolineae bacterium]
MVTFTMGLALEDFVPVILSSLGLFILARMVDQFGRSAGRMAYLGWALITLGGLFKALWKLIMALSNGQTDVAWMDLGLFLWMGTGFTFMAFAVWHAQRIMRGKKAPKNPWLAPIIIVALNGFGAVVVALTMSPADRWRFVFLGLTTIANVALAVLLIVQAYRQHQYGVMGLFVLNIVIVFALSGMARIPDQTIPLQWMEQILNTLAQGAFAVAAWRLGAKAVTRYSRMVVAYQMRGLA